MNLHSIVAPIIGAVNTNELVSLRQSIGFAVNVDFSRSPTYSTFPMSAQVQGLQSDDIRILNGLGIQGERRKVYLWGAWTGLVRSLQKGNDLMVRSDGSVWKVAYVFEDFGHSVSGTTGWCSVAAVLQSPASEDFYNPPLPPPPPVPGAVTAISLTANYVVQNTDSGTWFDNDSAAGPLTATLPAPTPGLEYHFTVTSAQTFQISAPTGVSVALGTAQSAPGGSVSSNLIFSSIFVYAPRGASNQWIAVSDTGGWNVA